MKKPLLFFLILVGIIVLILLGMFTKTVIGNIKTFDKIYNYKREIIVKQKHLRTFNLATKKSEMIALENNNFIHFWGTWCGPCIKEFPVFDSILATKQDYNIYFISEEEDSIILEFMNKNKYKNIPFYSIKEENNIFEIESYPTTFYKLNDSIYKSAIGQQDWVSFFK